MKAGEFHFAVGTTGSTTLILQTMLPALLLATQPSRFILEGGTYNPLAPPYEFLERAFLPLLARMGARVQIHLERPGFYPRGANKIVAHIQPCERRLPLTLTERGAVRQTTATVLLARLLRHIAERELAVVHRALSWPPESLLLREIPDSRGPGNVVLLEVESAQVTEVFSAVGRLGVRAEAVALNAVRQLQRYLATDAPVGEHLADQLLLPLALAGSGRFRTRSLSNHARTNLEIIRHFIPVSFDVEPEGGDLCRVTVGPIPRDGGMPSATT